MSIKLDITPVLKERLPVNIPHQLARAELQTMRNQKQNCRVRRSRRDEGISPFMSLAQEHQFRGSTDSAAPFPGLRNVKRARFVDLRRYPRG